MTAINDDAVEAGAIALFRDADGEFVQPDSPWLSSFEQSRRSKYTRRARLVLETALPHLGPDREAMAAAMHDHDMAHSWRDERFCPSCACVEVYLPRADAVLVVLKQSAEATR